MKQKYWELFMPGVFAELLKTISFLKHLVMKPEMLTSKSEKKSKQEKFFTVIPVSENLH